MHDSGVAQTWTRQFSGRLSGADFKLTGWLMNIPRGLCYFLPWTPILAFANTARFSDDRRASLAQGILWGIAIAFVGMSLLPGSLARYTMPLLAPAAWLMALLLTAERFGLPAWVRMRSPAAVRSELRLPAAVTALVCAAIALYVLALMPFQQRREKIRTIAAQINAALPPTEPLYALDPDYQPFLFYVHNPIIYVDRAGELPASARYVLVQPTKERQITGSRQWQPRLARPVMRLTDYRKKEVILLEVSEGG
jgi:hypothetical protein